MPVVKILELIGVSNASWEDAVKEALTRASKTVKNITGIDVLGWKGVVSDGKITEYRAHVKVAFTVEEKVE